MIKIRNLSKKFDDQLVLDAVNLTVDRGSVYGVVGSNGSGKTTLFKLIMGVYKPDQGEVMFGEKTLEPERHLQEIYYVQDDLYLPQNITLKERFLEEKLYYPHANESVFNHLLQFFGLERDKKLVHLSKGQNKQAAFILAMASGASIVLLDEIVDGLDAVVRKKFWKVILSEVMERKLTVVIASHALGELDNICDKIGMLHGNKIIREESMDNLKQGVKRIQFAVKEPFIQSKNDAYEILKEWSIGKVTYVYLKGNTEAFQMDLDKNHKVLLFEELDMNLEEIFISELGGAGYGNEIY